MVQVDYQDFLKVEIATGTILSALPNPKAKKPAYVLEIDFGKYGIKISSAQITDQYLPNDLVGMQVVGVMNFPARRIAGVVSEVLILGAVTDDQGVVLLQPRSSVENGVRIL